MEIGDSLAEFVTALWETGMVAVSENSTLGTAPEPDDQEEAWSRLLMFAAAEADAFPGPPPSISRVAAEWALLMLRRACGLLVHRQANPELIRTTLDTPCPEKKSPIVCWSVDLSFRHLPELARLVAAAWPEDPLLAVLLEWGREWQLSSVGMSWGSDQANSASFDLDPWWEDAGLRRVYIDRVLSREDRSRLTDLRVATAVRTALGDHPELSPRITTWLELP